MRRTLLSLITLTMVLTAMAEDVMKKEGNTYIVNTTTLCKTRGYRGTTPLEVYIEKGKVVKIVALPNRESKGYFNPMTKKLFALFTNQKVKEAEKLSTTTVDATTGATFSGKAVQDNINAALKYYKEKK